MYLKSRLDFALTSTMRAAPWVAVAFPLLFAALACDVQALQDTEGQEGRAVLRGAPRRLLWREGTQTVKGMSPKTRAKRASAIIRDAPYAKSVNVDGSGFKRHPDAIPIPGASRAEHSVFWSSPASEDARARVRTKLQATKRKWEVTEAEGAAGGGEPEEAEADEGNGDAPSTSPEGPEVGEGAGGEEKVRPAARRAKRQFYPRGGGRPGNEGGHLTPTHGRGQHKSLERYREWHKTVRKSQQPVKVPKGAKLVAVRHPLKSRGVIGMSKPPSGGFKTRRHRGVPLRVSKDDRAAGNQALVKKTHV
mmetsp:Transcript_8935/g.29549  ORF Transcript_8935/g.29549 Transcript_8935/m.29549 type:complete len:306 (-) Transcript_8935:98-1015(-)